MFLDKGKLIFQNFKPTQCVKQAALNLLDQISGESPSDSFTKTIIQRVEDTFVAQIRVISKAGTFLVEITDKDPLRVMTEATKGLREQLSEWKKHRFSDSAEKEVPVKA